MSAILLVIDDCSIGETSLPYVSSILLNISASFVLCPCTSTFLPFIRSLKAAALGVVSFLVTLAIVLGSIVDDLILFIVPLRYSIIFGSIFSSKPLVLKVAIDSSASVYALI